MGRADYMAGGDIFKQGRHFMKEAIINNLIPQTMLPEPYNKYGCNLRVMQAIGELIAERCLSLEEITMLAEEAKSLQYIGPNPRNLKEGGPFDVYLYKPEKVANEAASYLGGSGTVWNSGKVYNGEPIAWNGEKTKYFDWCVIKLLQENGVDNHFVLGKKDFSLAWDPTPGSRSAKLWNVKDIYLYKIVRR